jgi:hypothetical protein
MPSTKVQAFRGVRSHEDAVGREMAELAGFVGNVRGLMPVIEHGGDLSCGSPAKGG